MSHFCSYNTTKENSFSTKNLGGKGFNLLKLHQAGKNVPKFILLPTEAFQFFLSQKMENETLNEVILSKLKLIHEESTLEEIRKIGEQLRSIIENYEFKDKKFTQEFEENVVNLIKSINDHDLSFAVRSSATDEDLSNFSFAGQHDTYLNIKPDIDLLLKMVKKCWGSIFSDRALIYRQKNLLSSMESIPLMCVVIQQMVKHVKYSGIMFTSDPLNSNRRMIAIDASYGLGEALVSGLVTADSYRVNKMDMTIHSKTISKKLKRIVAFNNGTTTEEDVPKELQDTQALSDELIVKLAENAKNIENVYECQQDIEFAISVTHEIFILQSRPITSLIEIPQKLTPFYETHEKFDIEKDHGYFCFNHLQVMTDPIKPLGLSSFQQILTVPCEKIASKEIPDSYSRVCSSEGRLYINITDGLSTFPSLIEKFLGGLVDQWIGMSIHEFTSRKEFKKKGSSYSFMNIFFFILGIIQFFLWVLWRFLTVSIQKVDYFENFKFKEQTLDEDSFEKKLKQTRNTMVNNFISMFSNAIHYLPLIMFSFKIGTFLHPDVNDLVVGCKLKTTLMNNEISNLSRIANKSSKLMKLLKSLDVTKCITPDDLVKNIKKNLDPQDYKEFIDSLESFLKEYGFRGISEIDITADRFIENLNFIVNIILNSNDFSNMEEKESNLTKKREESLDRLLTECYEKTKYKWWNLLSFGILGFIQNRIAKRIFTIFRQFFIYREHPKHMMMSFFYQYKQNILTIVNEELVSKGLMKDPKDVFYLTYQELIFISKNQKKELFEQMNETISKRKLNYIKYEKTSPSRFLTSYGENIELKVQQNELKNLPPNTFIGCGVAPGTSTGIVRVVIDPMTAIIKEGEIIVAKNIDPAFSALFSHCVALVSEVGGLMTHGSVVAREMGIPAVVGMFNATKILKDGQKIKVNGNIGTVQILE
jgi:rifampicin phosphotransferase